jgi:hypothetical protein
MNQLRNPLQNLPSLNLRVKKFTPAFILPNLHLQEFASCGNGTYLQLKRAVKVGEDRGPRGVVVPTDIGLGFRLGVVSRLAASVVRIVFNIISARVLIVQLGITLTLGVEHIVGRLSRERENINCVWQKRKSRVRLLVSVGTVTWCMNREALVGRRGQGECAASSGIAAARSEVSFV